MTDGGCVTLQTAPPPQPAPGQQQQFTFHGPPGLTPEQQQAFVQAQLQHQQQLENTKQANLQRAQTLPSIDDEVSTRPELNTGRSSRALLFPCCSCCFGGRPIRLLSAAR